MCTDPEVSRRIFSLPNLEYTRVADNKVLTGGERIQAGRGFGSVVAGKAPSESEKAALLGRSESKSVSSATQTSRRRAAAAAQPVIPGKTPVMK